MSLDVLFKSLKHFIKYVFFSERFVSVSKVGHVNFERKTFIEEDVQLSKTISIVIPEGLNEWLPKLPPFDVSFNSWSFLWLDSFRLEKINLSQMAVDQIWLLVIRFDQGFATNRHWAKLEGSKYEKMFKPMWSNPLFATRLWRSIFKEFLPSGLWSFHSKTSKKVFQLMKWRGRPLCSDSFHFPRRTIVNTKSRNLDSSLPKYQMQDLERKATIWPRACYGAPWS